MRIFLDGWEREREREREYIGNCKVTETNHEYPCRCHMNSSLTLGDGGWGHRVVTYGYPW